MNRRGSVRILVFAAIAAGGTAVLTSSVRAPADAAEPALKTPWGDPDLEGIWTDETATPLQRPAKYANQEFFSDAQRTELDKERAELLGRERRVQRGTELDVAGAYNGQFASMKRTGSRTSMISDPPNGRRPPLTERAQKAAAEDREFRLALLQSTETCKNNSIACKGGRYDPKPSARRTELPPRYNTARMNRFNGPEDGALPDRCLTLGLPEFGANAGSFRRIVQTAGGITMFYDVGQGQGWQRNIVMNGSPHLPASIRQWFGDSRGRWDGNSLVVDVTNFSPKTDFMGARENLHLIERWTRTGPNTLEYKVTIEDPTVWTRPWTVTQEFTRQSNQDNRIYYEPRCIEGNYGLPGLMRGQRTQEKAFAEGKGPDPVTRDIATDFVGVEDDPLQ
ncbi:MAG: hypothetical protein KGO48_06935 [Alphaproteobacteria bacterium]|nr:hypothetical protein [Alphaproteobacteria bacterium]